MILMNIDDLSEVQRLLITTERKKNWFYLFTRNSLESLKNRKADKENIFYRQSQNSSANTLLILFLRITICLSLIFPLLFMEVYIHFMINKYA